MTATRVVQQRRRARSPERRQRRHHRRRTTACTSVIRTVLRLVRELADARGLDAVCVTFDRHPAEVVRPESAPKLLTDHDQKLELLDATGFLDHAARPPLRRGAQSQEPAEDFVHEVLVGLPRRGSSWSAPTSTSGTSAAATSPLLERMGARARLRGARPRPRRSPERPTARPYSSTPIRELLGRGDVAGAAALLGRPHEVRGTVERRRPARPRARLPDRQRRGARRRSACPPTASTPGFVGADGVERPTAISLGRRPTFYERRRACRCSRPTCSTSTATCTASASRSGSSSGCGARSASTPSRTWSRRWQRDVEATRRLSWC